MIRIFVFMALLCTASLMASALEHKAPIFKLMDSETTSSKGIHWAKDFQSAIEMAKQ